MLKGKLERELDNLILLNFGSRGLHRVHGTFQTGVRASGFEIVCFYPCTTYSVILWLDETIIPNRHHQVLSHLSFVLTDESKAFALLKEY